MELPKGRSQTLYECLKFHVNLAHAPAQQVTCTIWSAGANQRSINYDWIKFWQLKEMKAQSPTGGILWVRDTVDKMEFGYILGLFIIKLMWRHEDCGGWYVEWLYWEHTEYILNIHHWHETFHTMANIQYKQQKQAYKAYTTIKYNNHHK